MNPTVQKFHSYVLSSSSIPPISMGIDLFGLSHAPVERKGLVSTTNRNSPLSCLSATETNKSSKIGNVFKSKSLESIESNSHYFSNFYSEEIGFSTGKVDELKNLIDSIQILSIVLIFSDFSCNLSTTSRKLCVSSARCNTWNCTCEKNHQRFQELHGIAVSNARCKNFFIPLSGKGGSTYDAELSSQLLCALITRKCSLVVYNSQLVLVHLLHWILKTRTIDAELLNIFDPRIAEYLLQPDIPENELEILSNFQRYGIIHSFTDQDCQRLTGARLWELQSKIMELHSKQLVLLEAASLMPVMRQIECPMSLVLAAMELNGFRVDPLKLRLLGDVIQLNTSEIVAHVRTLVHLPTLNLSSPEQISRLLYDQLSLSPNAGEAAPVESKKRKFASTSEQELLRIRDKHPIVPLILKYRTLSKVLSTYVEGIQPFILHDPVENVHRVHACWKQITVSTGRISCCKPNLQNIPITRNIDSIELDVRGAFLASEGYALVAADYSQIEMRIVAHLSQDQKLKQIFESKDGDIYVNLASCVFHKSRAEISEKERTSAKVICLGILYGMGSRAVAAKLCIDESAAANLQAAFLNSFPQLKRWMQNIRTLARENGFVTTICGRRRLLPDINSKDASKRSYAERQAVNSVVQGSASDVIKFAMIEMNSSLAPYQLADTVTLIPRLVLQIHDELVYEVPCMQIASDADHSAVSLPDKRFVDILQHVMEVRVKEKLLITVPLLVTVKWGSCWNEI